MSGYAGLFPVVLAALYWRRCTKQGAVAGIVSVIVLWITFFLSSIGEGRAYTVGDTGVIPVVGIVLGSAIMTVVVSLATPGPDRATLHKFFPDDASLGAVGSAGERVRPESY